MVVEGSIALFRYYRHAHVPSSQLPEKYFGTSYRHQDKHIGMGDYVYQKRQMTLNGSS